MNKIDKLLNQAKQSYSKGNIAKTKEILDSIVSQEPENIAANYILGLVASTENRSTEAIKHFDLVDTLGFKDPHFFYNYGLVLQRLAQYQKATEQYQKALSLKPNYIDALNNSSAALHIMGKNQEAEDAAKKIITLDPTRLEPYVNLGNILKDSGRFDEAISYYKKGLEIDPGNEAAGSNLLLGLCYSNRPSEEIFFEHTQWEKRVATAKNIQPFKHKSQDSNKKHLRIGYVSADFKTHSVAYYIEPILRNHDYEQFSIFCYSDVVKPDPVTLHLQQFPLIWRSIVGKNNDEVFSMVQNDAIDILVDLAGHSGNNRMGLFLRKPAPMQVTYLGYPNTTGLSTIDFRLTDQWADPEIDSPYYTEKLFHLSDGFLCYVAPQNSPDVSELPAIKNGFVTFGSFNNLPKISPETIDVWSRILKAIPTAKLMIKTKPFNDESVRNIYVNHFNNRGIDSNRLLFSEYSRSLNEHLACYGSVDIALDTFPYNGTTTTCEAFWMGVPVITLTGKAHAGRVGHSLLTRIGLSGMIASDIDRYVSLATFLAGDVKPLAKLRSALRATLAQSSICNGAQFTKSLEIAYGDMWKQLNT